MPEMLVPSTPPMLFNCPFSLTTLSTRYFAARPSASAIRNTIASLRHEYGVARVTFVSRKAAFRTMKHRYPNLLSNVVFNPLTDSIDVRLTTERARPSIVMHLKRLPIVEHIDSHPNGY